MENIMENKKQVLITDPKQLDDQPEIKKILTGLQDVKSTADLLIKTVDNKKMVEITNKTIQAKVVDIRARIKKGKKLINDNMDFFLKPLNLIVKSIREKKKELTGQLEWYEKIMAKALIDYDNKLEEERKKKEEERLKKIEEEKKKKEAEEQKLKEKMAIESDEGKKEELNEQLETVQQSEINIPSEPIEEKNVIQSANNKTHTKSNWKARIIDKKAFIEYALKNDLIECIEITESKINKLAKLYKDTKKMPGLEFWNDKYLGK
jgi:hypothetical protein